MAIARVQNVFLSKTGLPEDAIVNTWHFTRVGDFITDEAAEDLADNVFNFYRDGVSPAGAMITAIAQKQLLSVGYQQTKVYDITNGPSGPPRHVRTHVNGEAKNDLSGLPNEVCVCMSFRGDLVPGSNAARRRGRIYIGPLSLSTGVMIDDPINGQLRVAPGIQASLLANARKLKIDAQAAGWTWVVYSPTGRAAGNDGQVTTEVKYAWVDNAFDTQRRRGIKASDRATMVIP